MSLSICHCSLRTFNQRYPGSRLGLRQSSFFVLWTLLEFLCMIWKMLFNAVCSSLTWLAMNATYLQMSIIEVVWQCCQASVTLVSYRREQFEMWKISTRRISAFLPATSYFMYTLIKLDFHVYLIIEFTIVEFWIINEKWRAQGFHKMHVRFHVHVAWLRQSILWFSSLFLKFDVYLLSVTFAWIHPKLTINNFDL